MADDELPTKPPLPVDCRPSRPPLPASAQDSPPPPPKPPLPNSKFYVDSAGPTSPPARQAPTKSGHTRPAPARPAPSRPAPARPPPLRTAPVRPAPVRPAPARPPQQPTSTFYVEHPPNVSPPEDSPKSPLSPKGLLSPKSGQPLPMKYSPKAGKVLPEKHPVKQSETNASPTRPSVAVAVTSPKVDAVAKQRTFSFKGKSEDSSSTVTESLRVGRSKSLYQRPTKSNSPEPSPQRVTVDDSHLSRLQKGVTGSPPPPPRPSLPKAFEEQKQEERPSQAVKERRMRSVSSPVHSHVDGSEKGSPTHRERSTSSAESGATATSKDVSPTPKRKSTVRRIMDKLGSPNSRRKSHPANSTQQSGSLLTVSEESGSARKVDDSDGSDKPHKGRFSKFVGSMRGKSGKSKDGKLERRHMTTPALPVTRAMHREDTTHEDGVLSRLVAQCLGYLNRPHVLKEEGLFRIPGSLSDINRLRAAFIAGRDVNLSEVHDPNTVASLLKQYFKELKKPLIPLGSTQKNLLLAMRAKDLPRVKEIVQSIPLDRLSSLQIMIEILAKVVEYSEYNKMSLTNVATSCGQSIFNNMSPVSANDMLLFVIQHREEIFT